MVDGNMPTARSLGWNSYEYSRQLLLLNPDVIVTECSALTFESMTNAVRPCKEALGTILILTGPLGTSDPARAKAAGWDYVVAGEYERQVLNILNENLTESQDVYIDLDWLPFPEDEDICRLNYWEHMNPCDGMIQLYATRGCPLSCTFCAVPMYYGGHGNVSRSHRQRDPDRVCDEIEYLANRYGDDFSGCFFNDEAHNASAKWLSDFCQRLIERRLNCYSYDAMCGYWTFTRELVELCARAGYRQIRIGVESLEDSAGKAIKKKMFLEKLETFMEWCHEFGILVFGTFQIGAPGSTPEGDIATMRRANVWRKNSRMQRWQCSISTPQPGTPFYAQAKQSGWLVTEDLSHYNGCEAVVSYPHYPHDQIQKIWSTMHA